MTEKVYFSYVSDDKTWDSSGEIAKLIAIPKKWWNIKHWIIVNSFLKSISGFIKESSKK